MSQLDNLKLTVKILRSAVTKKINAINEALQEDEKNVNEIANMFETLQNRFNQLSTESQVLFKIYVETDETLAEQEMDKMEHYESNYVKTKNIVTSLKFDPQQQSIKQIETCKLPTLELPKFKGDILEYTTFIQTYMAAVDSKSISGVEKFTYLSSLLIGEPSNLIAGLTISNESYKIALDILKKEYGNKKKIAREHIRQLLDLHYISGKKVSLKSNLATIETHVRSLETLGIDSETYGIFLNQIILATLPHSLKLQWARRDINGDNSLKDLITFIHDEISCSEYANETSKNKENFSNKSQRAFVVNNNPSNKVFNPFCHYCKNNHWIQNCPTFLNLKTEDRFNFIKSSSLCYICFRKHKVQFCKFNKCSKCNGNHSHLLCFAKANKQQISSVTVSSFKPRNQNLLGTLNLLLIDSKSKVHNCRALLDTGSQHTYITSEFFDKLQIRYTNKAPISIIGFGENCKTVNSKNTSLSLFVPGGNTLIVNSFVVDKLCGDIDPPTFNKNEDIDLIDLKFADGSISDKKIHMIIGVDSMDKILTGQMRFFPNSKLMGLESIYGWILFGSNENVLNESKHFVRMDNFGSAISLNCFQSEIDNGIVDIQLVEDRVEVNWPWKRNPLKMDSNYANVLKRSHVFFNKLENDKETLTKCNEVIEDYKEKGIIEMVNFEEPATSATEKQCVPYRYHPLLVVLKPERETTKVRLVVDSSARDRKGQNINNFIDKGLNLLPLLFFVLIKFRLHKYAISSDIKQAFLQIRLSQESQEVTRFFWLNWNAFKNGRRELCVYKYKRLLFGFNASPFILAYVLQNHIQNCQQYFKQTHQYCLENYFYMDDFIFSTSIKNDCFLVKEELSEALNAISMKLVKWSSNIDSLNENSSVEERSILGVKWNVLNDTLEFSVSVDLQKLSTRRTVLQQYASIWDPLGYLEPLVVLLKVLIQECWLSDGWDCLLDKNLILRITELLSNWINVKIIVSRSFDVETISDISIHAFSDASQQALGIVLFLSHNEKLYFVCSKSRVVSKKRKITLPKLELEALSWVCEQAYIISSKLKIDNSNVKCYTDSMVALGWAKSERENLEPFIDRRRQKIKQFINTSNIKHVPGKINPADLPSRGMEKFDRKKYDEWVSGELVRDLVQNHANSFNLCITQSTFKQVFDFSSYRSFLQVLKIVKIVSNFIMKKTNSSVFQYTLEKCELIAVRAAQLDMFLDEIRCLMKDKPLKRTSNIYRFQCFLDENSILRINTRLQNSYLTFEEQFPILLRNHSFTKLLILFYHKETAHGSARDVLNQIRSKYWLIKGKQVIKMHLKSCFHCVKVNARKFNEPFGPLPTERIQPTSFCAFDNLGIDYAGPFYIRCNSKTTKCYLLLISCMQTRAINIEVTKCMDVSHTFNALQRHFSRFGIARVIWWDNAKTFKALDQHLQDRLNIETKHTTERAPWQGGSWEILVKLVKKPIRAVMKNTLLDEDDFNTLVCRVTAIVNSRPLTDVPDCHLDNPSLCPSHFLIGRSFLQANQKYCSSEIKDRKQLLNLYLAKKSHIENIWKRWFDEYLKFLKPYSKFQKSGNINVGQVVLLDDEKSSKRLWPLAKVLAVHRGIDGKVRNVTILCNGKQLKRPIQKLYELEFNVLPGEDV